MPFYSYLSILPPTDDSRTRLRHASSISKLFSDQLIKLPICLSSPKQTDDSRTRLRHAVVQAEGDDKGEKKDGDHPQGLQQVKKGGGEGGSGDGHVGGCEGLGLIDGRMDGWRG